MGFQLGLGLGRGRGLGLRAKAAGSGSGSGCGLGLRLGLRGEHAADVVVHARLVGSADLERRAVCEPQHRRACDGGAASCGAAGRGVRRLSIRGASGGGRTRSECVSRCAKRLMQRAEVEVRLRVGRSARKLWRARRG